MLTVGFQLWMTGIWAQAKNKRQVCRINQKPFMMMPFQSIEDLWPALPNSSYKFFQRKINKGHG